MEKQFIEVPESKQTEVSTKKHSNSSIAIIAVAITIIIIIGISVSSFLNRLENVRVANELGGLSKNSQQNSPQINTEKVIIESIQKGFYTADIMSGKWQDQITLDVKFNNKTNKEISGVEGVVTFYDIFDNKIQNIRISYDKGIPANSSKVYEAGIDYNQFIEEDQKLKEVEKFRYKWKVSTIIYADGTKETF